VLVGPTGVGKSRVALHLARLLDGEVVGADSMQVYRGLDVGTDKVSETDRRRVPHHLIDVCSPEESMDLGRWVALAERAVAEIRERGRTPIVVGGTGLYVRGLLKGVFDGRPRNPDWRRVLTSLAESRGGDWLHAFLARLDPDTAGRVSASDRKKVVRALEVILHAGRPFSALTVEWSRHGDRYRCLKVGLFREREDLRLRIDRRVEEMYHLGLKEEVQRLVGRGVPEDANAFLAIGYREALRALRGEWDDGRAIEETKRASRRYAKRQMTWFRKEEGLVWIDASGEPEAVAKEIARRYRDLLQDGGP